MNGFPRRLVLTQRQKATRKLRMPIAKVQLRSIAFVDLNESCREHLTIFKSSVINEVRGRILLGAWECIISKVSGFLLVEGCPQVAQS